MDLKTKGVAKTQCRDANLDIRMPAKYIYYIRTMCAHTIMIRTAQTNWSNVVNFLKPLSDTFRYGHCDRVI